MRNLFTLLFLLILCSCGNAQITDVQPLEVNPDSGFKTIKVKDKYNCRYHINPPVDIAITAVEGAGSLAGLYFLLQKPPVETSVILNLNPDDIIPFNRPAVHLYSEDLTLVSDAIFVSSILYGTVLLFDHDIRQDVSKVGLLYTQMMLLDALGYTAIASSVDKLRPFAYNTDSNIVDGQKVPEVPMEKRTDKGAWNSFYGGHPGTTAASTLFVAIIYSSYHPHSPWRFVFYGVAATSTAAAAWVRYQAGYHFPTDIIAGVAIGAAYGLTVPLLHRCKKDNSLSVAPFMGNGISMRYTF